LKNKTAYTIEENDMLVLHSTNIREELAEPMRTNEIREVPTTHAGGLASEEPGELRTVRKAEEA
jgi:regulator of replication initiation timing